MYHSFRVASRIILACVLACAGVSAASAQSGRSGAELYRAGCAVCHGDDGRGAPRSQTGFDVPLPDFTDCAFASHEPDRDWQSVIRWGGPARAFDRHMPAFGDALTADEIDRVIVHLRSFCTNRRWPSGELNLPRPLATHKAFPENEGLLTTRVVSGEPRSVENHFVYEHRLGPRSEYEVEVPVDVRQQPSGVWHKGLGDISVGFKHVLVASERKGTIVTAGSELTFPTGKENEGLGRRLTTLEPFVAFGQLLPREWFVQAHGAYDIPLNIETANREISFRAAVGKTLGHMAGRSWSPMLEVLAARELDPDDSVQWDLVPQILLTLSRRQHVSLNAGVRMPVTRGAERNRAVLVAVLWDWSEGGLFEGWR